MGLISKLFGYGFRGLKVLPEFLLGTGSEAVGAGIRGAKGQSIWTKVKAGGLALEKDIATKAANGGFFKRNFKELISLPKAIKTEAAAGKAAAKALSKSGTLGGFKGVMKAIGKKMPMIGAILTIVIEAPNIIRAFKEGGTKAGLKEIGGAGVELGCMATGAAIGSAICPGIGTIIGGVVGSIAGMFVRGKTFTQKKQEAEQKANEELQIKSIEELRKKGYTDDDIQKLMESGINPSDAINMLNEMEKTQSQTTTSATTASSVTTVPTTIDYSAYPTTQTNPLDFGTYSASALPFGSLSSNYLNDFSYQQPFGSYLGLNYPLYQNNQTLYNFKA